MVSVP